MLVECGFYIKEYKEKKITGKMLTRNLICSVSTGIVGFGLINGSTSIGAALGTFLIPIPGVGTAIGGIIGYVIGICIKFLVGKGINALGDLFVSDI